MIARERLVDFIHLSSFYSLTLLRPDLADTSKRHHACGCSMIHSLDLMTLMLSVAWIQTLTPARRWSAVVPMVRALEDVEWPHYMGSSSPSRTLVVHNRGASTAMLWLQRHSWDIINPVRSKDEIPTLTVRRRTTQRAQLAPTGRRCAVNFSACVLCSLRSSHQRTWSCTSLDVVYGLLHLAMHESASSSQRLLE
jgi:hypothetical protein